MRPWWPEFPTCAKISAAVQKDHVRELVPIAGKLLDVIADMGIGGEEILESIVVEVNKPNTPASQPSREPAHMGRIGLVPKASIPGVSKHWIRLAGQRGVNEVGPAVVIVVAKIYAHPRDRLSIIRKRNACIQRYLFKLAVLQVVKEKRRFRVVGDVEVRP